jgi:hypothetical protein
MEKPAPKMNKLKNSNVKSAKMTTWNVGGTTQTDKNNPVKGVV